MFLALLPNKNSLKSKKTFVLVSVFFRGLCHIFLVAHFMLKCSEVLREAPTKPSRKTPRRWSPKSKTRPPKHSLRRQIILLICLMFFINLLFQLQKNHLRWPFLPSPRCREPRRLGRLQPAEGGDATILCSLGREVSGGCWGGFLFCLVCSLFLFFPSPFWKRQLSSWLILLKRL